MQEKICKICGKPFETNNAKQLCCSPACMFENQRRLNRIFQDKKRKPLIKKKCAHCGAEFETYDETKIYCSEKCGNRYRYLQKLPPIKRKCIVCGKEFETSGKVKKYCSDKCCRAAQRLKKNNPKVKKICPTCGVEFITSIKRHKFCSGRCRDKFKYLKPPQTLTKTCPICGKDFQTAIKYKKYCSKKCGKIDWYARRRASRLPKVKKVPPPKPVFTKTCKIYGEEFTTSDGRQRICSDACRLQSHKISNRNCYHSKTKTPKLPKVKFCANCGKVFETYYDNQKYCSESCGNSIHQHNYYERHKVKKPKTEPTEFELTPEQIAQRERLKAELLRRRKEREIQEELDRIEALENENYQTFSRIADRL